MLAAQANQVAVVVEHRILVSELCLRVDFGVARVQLQPRGAGGEACVLASGPLHGGAGVIAAGGADVAKHVLRGDAARLFNVLAPGVVNLQVVVVLHIVEEDVGHAQLFTLVDVGGALHQVQHGAEHLGADGAVLGGVVTEAGDGARLVVVVPVQGVPAAAVQAFLPVGEDLLEVNQVEAAVGPLAGHATFGGVYVHVLELEHHLQLVAVETGVECGVVHGHAGGFAHGHDRVLAQDLAVHLLQEFVHARAVGCDSKGVVEAASEDCRVLGEGEVLRNQVDDVHAEAVHALVQPEAHDVVDLFADLRVLPVQVGLLDGEVVQVELAGRLVPLPYGGAEARNPVVRRNRLAVLVESLGIAPDVVVAVGVVLGGACLLEPFVLVGSVVDDQVHHELDAVLVRGFEQLIEVFHGAELGHDGTVVGDVVAVVVVRGSVDGGEPQHLNTQIGEVRNLLGDTGQVTDAVAVGVVEGAGVDLVNNGFLPPLGLGRHCSSFPWYG